MANKNGEANHWKGLALGVAGGVAGLTAMRYYWQAATAVRGGKDPRGETSDTGPHKLDDISLVGEHHKEGESSTASIGRILDKAVTGEDPGKEAKTVLSYGVHWGYGLTMAGLYGTLRGGAGIPDPLGGLAFGTALWLLGSEIALPLLGLSAGPTTIPKSGHMWALGAHFAYGLTTAATTQILYKLL